MSYSIDIISRIKERFVEMTDSEKKVAQFILDDIPAIGRLPIAKLAAEMSVSPATITRFAKSLDCEDVRDLKMKLVQSMAVGQRFINDIPDLDGVQGIYSTAINALMLNRNAIDDKTLKKAANWISHARHSIVIGMGGGSSIVAQEVQHRLFRLGIPVSAYNDGLLVRMVSAAVEKNDVVIALSLGGYTQEIIESVSLAKHYGAKIIVITPNNTPLAEQADALLPIIVEENDYIYKPTASRYVMLAAVDVLATELGITNQRYTRDRLRRVKVALDSHRGGNNRQPLGD